MAKTSKSEVNIPDTPGGIPRRSVFVTFASNVARAAGRPATFMTAVAFILVWAATGPLFGFSETWQLVVNTGTTIITFLMVFLIQNTQNRDAYAVQLKLDEIIRASHGAHTELLDIEDLSEERLRSLRDLYEDLAKKAREKIARGEDGTDCPDIRIPTDDEEAKAATPQGKKAGKA